MADKQWRYQFDWVNYKKNNTRLLNAGKIPDILTKKEDAEFFYSYGQHNGNFVGGKKIDSLPSSAILKQIIVAKSGPIGNYNDTSETLCYLYAGTDDEFLGSLNLIGKRVSEIDTMYTNINHITKNIYVMEDSLYCILMQFKNNILTEVKLYNKKYISDTCRCKH